MTRQQRREAAVEWHNRHVSERDAIDRRIAELSTEADALRARLEESAGALKTVANLFSNSVWAILPAKIKTFFKEYRT